MKEILLFAGTTEGRKLSECLAASGIAHTICVATEYGEIVLKEHPLVTIHRGRMDQEQMRALMQSGQFAAVVDATHPYAELVTKNIKLAMTGIKLPYLRLKRKQGTERKWENIIYFDTNEACEKALEAIKGNILLTTGSKELSKYCVSEQVKQRLYVRVLPSIESISICKENGIQGKQIIAMQGPFTAAMNEAVIGQYEISCLVTKESGASGGYGDKLEAAKKANIPVFVVRRKKEEEGDLFEQLCDKLESICGKTILRNGTFEIILAGVGMGNKNNLTSEVQEAIEQADILLGAERMIRPYQAKLEKRPYYQAKQIIPYLKEMKQTIQNRKVVILFSGDSGFYSGCEYLYHALLEEINANNLNSSVRILPGISSVAYLAACVGESYQDAAICSMHGKTLYNLIHKIKTEPKLFLLISNVRDVNEIGYMLKKANLTECRVIIGYQLSYEEQQIQVLTPKECCEQKKEGLYTCLIKNPNPMPKKLTHGIADSQFIREKIPMTKEEVREISICKLKLYQEAVVYDIGSGTGSIAVEIANLSDKIQVYALEQKKEAVSLIEKNKQKFELQNITVIETKAPEGLNQLPKATHAFIGGSSGKLKQILNELYHINNTMRIVINAVSMETICEIKEILSTYPMEAEEIVQVQVSRAKKAGNYHLMQAENPVWICAFQWTKTKETIGL